MFHTPFFTFTHVVFNIWANRYRIEPLLSSALMGKLPMF